MESLLAVGCWLCWRRLPRQIAKYRALFQNIGLLSKYTTDGGDRTSNDYDRQFFQQVCTGVPVHVKHISQESPKNLQGVSCGVNRVSVTQKSFQENWKNLENQIF